MWNCTLGGLLWLILPFLIGLVTGWWVWAHLPRPVEAAANAPPFDSSAALPFAASTEVEPPAPQHVQAPDAVRIAPVESDPASGLTPEPVKLTAIGIPAAMGAADDLLQIKGIGPKLNAVLNDIGVVRFDQIAAWGDTEIARVDDHLGAFRGRIVRDAWVIQADLLAKGLIGEFEMQFGKLDSENQ